MSGIFQQRRASVKLGDNYRQLLHNSGKVPCGGKVKSTPGNDLAPPLEQPSLSVCDSDIDPRWLAGRALHVDPFYA